MSPPSADREDSAPLTAEESSDSEYEYEEIIEEVEEEEFVYEEVEVEEEEEEEEGEEEEEPEEKDAGEEDDTEAEHAEGEGVQHVFGHVDLIQNLRTEENDGHLIMCSSTAETCQSSLLSNAHLEHDSSQPGTSFSNLPSQRLDEKLTTSNEDPKSSKSFEHQVSPRNCGSRILIEDKKDGEVQLRAENPYCSDAVIKKNNDYLHNGDIINAENSNSYHLSENKRTISMTLDDHPDAEDNQALCAKEVKQKDMECNEESKHMDSRFVDCGEASRSSIPLVELPDRNKRAAIICDFFAKGWCVRGSSCRFVHLKDSNEQLPRDIATSHCKKEDDNGQREDRLRLRSMLDMTSFGGKIEFHSSLSSERILPYSSTPVDFHLPKCEDGFISKYGHAGRDRFSWGHHDDHRIHASSSDGVNSGTSGRNLRPCYGPSPDGSIMPLSINDNQVPSSYGVKELKSDGRSQFCENPSQLPMRHSLNSSLHSSPFETSTTVSPNASHLGAYKRMKFTPYNWELSVPFRPSFSLASLGISISGIQYDPFHDSIEKPSAGGASSPTKTSEEQITTGDIGGNHIPGSENDGHSGTSLSRVNEQVVDRDSHSYGKDTCTVVAETAENSIVDCQNENVMLEESSRLMDLCKNSRTDQVSLKKASRDDRVRNEIHNKGMRDSDGYIQHEPKSLKYFRSALIELVKVLLRPNWHKGRLSKDEHNMIVKKAVDKVVNTFLLDQIPSTKEATKQYLASSQPKIAKLVEGYVEKYSKS